MGLSAEQERNLRETIAVSRARGKYYRSIAGKRIPLRMFLVALKQRILFNKFKTGVPGLRHHYDHTGQLLEGFAADMQDRYLSPRRSSRPPFAA